MRWSDDATLQVKRSDAMAAQFKSDNVPDKVAKVGV